MLMGNCFSTMGELKKKTTAFFHKGYDQPHSFDSEKLLLRIHRGEDVFERGKGLCDRIDHNPDIPTYLQKLGNRQKFAYMIDRDPPNANFRDIP